MTDPTRTVWILGAGFSRSLGGPLLDDLLSPATNNFVSALYQATRVSSAEAEAIRGQYTQHGPDGHPSARLWGDAESFLDQLDAAAQGDESPAALRMSSVFTPPFEPYLVAAKRLVAAACCAFLHKANTKEERWQPYVKWASEMTPSDTIVTFNYDRVLELLRQFQIIFPVPGLDLRFASDHPRAYKLHGGVDWRRVANDQGRVTHYEDSGDSEFALTCDPKEIGIATPGPSKRKASEELAAVWINARRAIQEADAIVFVGYRFPPTDAEAREQLLGAIRSNKQPHLRVHLVLGPNRGHPDLVRLQQLIEYTMKRAGRTDATSAMIIKRLHNPSYALLTHALYAEDLFSVWDRDLIWPKALSFVD